MAVNNPKSLPYGRGIQPMLRVLLIVEDDGTARRIKECFTESGCAYVVDHVTTLLAGLEVAQGAYDVALMDTDISDGNGVQSFATLRAHAQHLPIILLANSDDSNLSSYAIKNGAQDWVVKSTVNPQMLTRVVQHAILRHRSAPERVASKAKVGGTIGIIGVRGGVGATSVATYLSLELSERRADQVLLADLDVRGGSVGLLLKAARPNSMRNLLSNLQRLDRGLWEKIVSKHSDRLDVVESADALDDLATPSSVRVALRFARSLYSWTVVDFGRLSPFNMPLLDDCSDILLVTNCAISSLHAAKRAAASLGSRRNVRLVIIEGQQRLEVGSADLGDLFGINDCRRVPGVERELHEALEAGRVLPKSSPFRKTLSALASEWTAGEAPIAEHGGRVGKFLAAIRNRNVDVQPSRRYAAVRG